ncbi:MAG TPA: TolC family protein [Phenylobacterium sp.]|uniref:TolC family protein n=1 Tax=Phenylobacterium sp. TaxID=1871053 RepID=UPI002C8D604D|nr:TolC family protein [Phenylobacterium sp.]HXA38880.1 TolC family protein [Phenylobacterium sp.]
MRSRVSAVLMACLALGACAHARPADVAMPAAFEGAKGPADRAPPGSIDLDRWWLAFNDPQLNGLIEQALARNPDARSAAARLTEARANRIESLTHYLPQGDVTGSTRSTDTHQLAGTVFNFPGFSSSGVSNASSANLNVSWEVDIFGRFLATRQAVNGDIAAARFNYEGARASLAANVADAYFLARGLAIQLADARESQRIQQELYDTAAKRGALGLAPTSDADRVAGDLAQAKALAEGLEAQLQAERRTLLILAGRIVEPTSNIAVEASVGELPPVPDSLPSELLKRRPDVREASARVAAATGRSQTDILALLPVINWTPGLAWSKQSQPGFSVTTQSVIAGGAITQPLFSIPKLLAELKAQNARTEQAVIAYEKSVQTAFADSEGALVNLDADRRRVALLTDGEARAARGYRASKLGYDRGLTDLQTALSAEQSWRSTRSQLTGAQVQAARRTIQVYKALGGGWPAERFPTDKQAR